MHLGKVIYVGNERSEVEMQDSVKEVPEESLNQAELSADNDSDVDNIKSDVEGGSSDEAPEEIKIVKYFENEDPCDAEMQSKFKPAVRM